MQGKKSFHLTILFLVLLPILAVAGTYQVRGTAERDAIDTLTISDNFFGRSTSPQATEMIIIQTDSGDSPQTTRNRIVAGAAGLESFIVSPTVQPDQFVVTDFEGGNPDVLLNEQLITTDPDGRTAHSGQNFVQVPSQIPTLSEWGLIVFATLLLASLFWYVLRRRKLIKAKT